MPSFRCSECGWAYGEGPDDQRRHHKRHRNWMSAVEILGEIRSGERLELAKERSWRILCAKPDADLSDIALLAIVRAHFERSVSASLDTSAWRHHADFECYCAAYHNSHLEEASPNAWRKFVERVGRRPDTRLPRDRTHWVVSAREGATGSSGTS